MLMETKKFQTNIPEQQCYDKHRQEYENEEIRKPMDKEGVQMSSEDMLSLNLYLMNWLKYFFLKQKKNLYRID